MNSIFFDIPHSAPATAPVRQSKSSTSISLCAATHADYETLVRQGTPNGSVWDWKLKPAPSDEYREHLREVHARNNAKRRKKNPIFITHSTPEDRTKQMKILGKSERMGAP